jgi:hypothetical protein
MKKPAGAARKKPMKKPGGAARKKQLDFADLGLGDLDDDSLPGLVGLGSDSETEDELAFGDMGFDDGAQDGGEDAADHSLDPPLIEVVRAIGSDANQLLASAGGKLAPSLAREQSQTVAGRFWLHWQRYGLGCGSSRQRGRSCQLL